jgi:metal-responsive CopG/Arc/MetJ family transcriptional regulator
VAELDEDLVRAVDSAVRRLKTTRSAFARRALRAALAQMQTDEKEKRHRRGYERQPVGRSEFSVWENEQAWPEH